jgi:asparagine synthase (glutamine-hydrolysing)
MPFPNFAPRIGPQAAAAFMRHACVPAPLTIYQGVHTLAPAHILAVEQSRQPKLFCYWDLLQIAEENERHIDGRPQSQIADDLDGLLRDAVVRQMVSDVPLGAFLSGGIDSSTVVALMQAQSNRKVHTFSIGSQNEAYNEASHAKLVAQHLGTEHTELIVDSKMARAVVDRLPDIYDEPFADSSQIPTFIVSQLARGDVTVSLSGDGGDECFAGYVRHHWSNLLALYSRNVPAVLSKTFGFALRSISPAAWDTILSPVPKRLRAVHAGDKIHKLAALLPLSDLNQMYRRVIAQWPEPQTVVPGSAEPLQPWHDCNITAALRDPMSQVRFYDTMQYLPDDILTKVDRASMAVSLEVRVPLLDHRVVKYSWRLPKSALIRGSSGNFVTSCIATCHRHWSSDRKRVSPYRSVNGFADRSPVGHGVACAACPCSKRTIELEIYRTTARRTSIGTMGLVARIVGRFDVPGVVSTLEHLTCLHFAAVACSN